ncbi:MAG: hypothetical protein JST17_15435 [Bacteroidetes bacterium]|nr:hypothetical protein [Bacteroidota bacterium]MBS1930577.1 hypothetical protein [Bacteroidota bacterium]
MKHLKLLVTIIFSVCIVLFYACNNPSGSQKSDNNQNSKSEDTPAGNASFSVNLDGALITGNVVDEMQLRNTAFLDPDNTVEFTLVSSKDGSDQNPEYSIKIMCPAKTGSSIHVGNIEFDKATMPAIYLDHLKGDYMSYEVAGVGADNSVTDTATVTIVSLSKTRITGTFSANISNEGKKAILTNGKFDIPFSTGTLHP